MTRKADAELRRGGYVWVDVRTATRRSVVRPTVLLVEENGDIRSRRARALAEIGFRVETASSAAHARTVARTCPIDFMLVGDHVITDDLIRTLRALAKTFQEPGNARNSAMTPSDESQATASAQSPPRSAAERWAMLALQACRSDGDLKTLADWAAFVGVSYSSLCEACRLVEVRPRDARDLVRVLRAILRSSTDGIIPAVLLDVRDRRTLRTLLDKAGIVSRETAVSVEQFLSEQRFVHSDNFALVALRRLLVVRPVAVTQSN
jgi:hypothetical protein